MRLTCAYDQRVHAAPDGHGALEQPSADHGDPPVSVVLVTYNRRLSLRRAIAALRAQTYAADRLEFIIVNNGSTDGSGHELAALEDPRFRGVTIAVNQPPAGARNQALAMATGEIVAFTDDDCQADPGWIAALVAGFEPGVDVVQGRTVPDGSTEHPRAVSQQIESLTGVYETCNIAYRREALSAVGGFDERLGFFGEDTAAGWSVIEAGGEARFAPDAVVRHDVALVDLAWRWNRGLRYGNWVALARTHPQLRRELFFGQHFLKRSSAAFDAALVGVVTARLMHRRWPLLLVAPYLVVRRPRRGGRAAAIDLAHAITSDAAVFTGLVRGSARERTVVL
jgi:glycosyltransferase involved in cell wall biosynthesis